MALERDREPVAVLVNPVGARRMAETPHWLTVSRYIEHENGDLTWIAFACAPRRRSQPRDWRKINASSE